MQFGFQKRLACSHAVFTARKIIDFYCAGNSTVNVALLDMSKAFDKVHHTILFTKLMQHLNLLLLVACDFHGLFPSRTFRY